jgi:hypothetical protein
MCVQRLPIATTICKDSHSPCRGQFLGFTGEMVPLSQQE